MAYRKLNSFLCKCVSLLILLVAQQSNAQPTLIRGDSFFDSTNLVEVIHGTELSLKARELRSGGFETSAGLYVDFNRWYSPEWYDTQISWMTQITSNFGIIWGFSTGENAEKYSIAPSSKLGFAYQTALNKNSNITFIVSTFAGGELYEKTCTADYGEIGGLQEVNCRLAATILTPADTLKYLVRARKGDTWQINYKFTF